MIFHECSHCGHITKQDDDKDSFTCCICGRHVIERTYCVGSMDDVGSILDGSCEPLSLVVDDPSFPAFKHLSCNNCSCYRRGDRGTGISSCRGHETYCPRRAVTFDIVPELHSRGSN